MYGWRGRIGMLIPTNNTVIEPEMARYAPEGVTFHATRMVSSRTGNASIDGLHNLVSCVDRGLEELSITGVNALLYGCLSTSFAVPGWGAEFRKKAAAWTNAPAITALEATCSAIQALGQSKIAVLCPYGPELQALAPAAFAAYGIELVSLNSLNVTGLQAVCNVPEQAVYEAAKQTKRTGAGLLCVLATDLPTAACVPVLEADLGLPVVSTNQAIAWASLTLAGVNAIMENNGSLFLQPFSGLPKAVGHKA